MPLTRVGTIEKVERVTQSWFGVLNMLGMAQVLRHSLSDECVHLVYFFFCPAVLWLMEAMMYSSCLVTMIACATRVCLSRCVELMASHTSLPAELAAKRATAMET